ncbi:MAG: DMT family transporter [Candidatus Gastranaerophilales bacterium]|nr:DMT family transporter [Candidatus Gastranaerophilales bacterium]
MNSLIRIRANFYLFITALIWGSTFVAQKSAMSVMGPFTFNGVRCLLGSIALFIIAIFVKSKNYKLRPLIEGGVVAGLFLFMATTLQQTGITATTAGHAGFISSLYIVMVPVFSLFLGQKIDKYVWFGVLMALFGLYLLSFDTGFSINRGDLIVLSSAIFYAFHIMWIGKYAKKTDAIRLSCIQFFLAGLFSLLLGIIFENTEYGAFSECALEIFISGVLSCAVAFTLQISAQKYVRPYIASLIMSLESVFAILAGYIFLHEILTVKELIGCFFMFAALFIAHKNKKS